VRLRIISLLRKPNELHQRAFVFNEQLNTKSDTQTYTNLDEDACAPSPETTGNQKFRALLCQLHPGPAELGIPQVWLKYY
jgi:hypothetical protein